ncbi:MAG: methionyl-tRNA formyltransferase [Pseudobutyrivibrio sp.]|nr:methionyl-tRNA formyltransferase [Pseudobutyrivibrio sp.]
MKIVFMGTPDFSVATVDAIYKASHEITLVVTQPDKPRGRSGALSPSPVKEWALEHDIPVFQPERIKRPEAVAELKKYEADLFVVTAFGQILSQEILDMPRFGCINVHASLLPKYRGAAPIQWAVLNGDEVSGVTTMMMAAGIDDGDMLLKKEYKLASDETGGSLFDKLAVMGGELIVETIDKLSKGMITPQPQDESEATHVGMIKKEDGCIDFSNAAVVIERQIRGLNPWPSAYTKLDGKTLKLWSAKVVSGVNKGQPGEVIAVDKTGFTVNCGLDSLYIMELQLEGKKRMKAGDFLRGYNLTEGVKLG